MILIAPLTVLSLASSILVMVRSFTRIVVVPWLLRTALGTAPVVVSLPFRLIFFVLVDGSSLAAGSLVQSYRT